MLQIKFDIQGQIQLSRDLNVSAGKISNMKEFHRDAIDIMSKKSSKIFSTKGKNVEKNPTWSPLAGSTSKARDKGRGYYRNPPNNPSTLRWTGRLQESEKQTITDKFGLLEFTASYAKYHQEGGKNLPRRAIIDLDNNTNNLIVKALQGKIQRDLGIFGKQI